MGSANDNVAYPCEKATGQRQGAELSASCRCVVWSVRVNVWFSLLTLWIVLSFPCALLFGRVLAARSAA